MTQVTVRKVDDDVVAAAKAQAAERGVSMNTVLVEALRKQLGTPEKPKTNGLEQFAGDSADLFDEKWEKFLNEDLMEIHPDDWK